MKITSIRQQSKNPGRASVFVDGKYGFSLSLDELVRHKLKNGDELDAADVKKFKKISTDGKLRARALEWLLNRPHSEREFRDYLYHKKVEPEQIENLVGEFSKKGYLDNAKFTEWFVDLQVRRGKSNRAIRAELYKKGISRDLAEQSIAQQSGGEEQRLRELVAKKQKLPRYKTDPQKLKEYLARQGFGFDLINDVMKNT